MFIIPNHGSKVLNRRDQRVFFFARSGSVSYRSRQRKKKPSGTQGTLTHAFQIFHAYEAASGARINLQKCKGLWSGSYRARTDSPTPFEWTNTSLPDKLLGLYVGNTDCTNQNLESKIHKLRNITAAWRHRDLSLKGRALVINGLDIHALVPCH